MNLRDGTVRLRAFREDDVPGIVDACSDADTVRFIPHIPVPYDEREARAYLEATREWAAGGNRVALAIADEESDRLLGAIDVRLEDEGTIGYWMAPSARNSGVATRALILLSRWAVSDGGVRRLRLTTHPDNIASQRVAEKAGFERIGVTDDHASFRDGTSEAVLFELPPDT
jgi:RimJ/RimL family protein N-acetyltransferase